MIIVSKIALSTMISNTLLTPWLIKRSYFQRMLHTDVSSLLLLRRRLIIVGLLLLAYLFSGS